MRGAIDLDPEFEFQTPEDMAKKKHGLPKKDGEKTEIRVEGGCEISKLFLDDKKYRFQPVHQQSRA